MVGGGSFEQCLVSSGMHVSCAKQEGTRPFIGRTRVGCSPGGDGNGQKEPYVEDSLSERDAVDARTIVSSAATRRSQAAAWSISHADAGVVPFVAAR